MTLIAIDLQISDERFVQPAEKSGSVSQGKDKLHNSEKSQHSFL